MIVGTAGHIDHGKTTLVRALTGVDTDRLPEEKRRGISIELGYAFLDTPLGDRIGFVDVPGHERLVHTMLAGATGIDFALLLVAADDGVMPQTREHLALLSLLGLSRGAVLVTKTDRVDSARLQRVCAEAAALIEHSPLFDAPLLPVSATTGAGLDAVRSLLFAEARNTRRPAPDQAAFRLAIDRVFTIDGTGTVVTGTVHAGHVRVGDVLAIAPGCIDARVRSLHAQNRPVAQALAGQRCAVALVGVSRNTIDRGSWLVAKGCAIATTRVDAEIIVWKDEAQPLRSGRSVLVHIGASSVAGSVAILDREAIAPGQAGRVQVLLRAQIGAWHGDRIVLRDAMAHRPLAGGRVLDPFAPMRYRRTPQRLAELEALAIPDTQASLEALLSAVPHGVDLRRFRASHGASALAVPPGALRSTDARVDWAIGPKHNAEARRAVVAELVKFHEHHPDEPGPSWVTLRRLMLPRWPESCCQTMLADLKAEGTVQSGGSFIQLSAHAARFSEIEKRVALHLASTLAGSGFDGVWARDMAQASGESEVLVHATLRRLAQRGDIHQVVKFLYYRHATLVGLAEVVRQVAHESEGRVSAARFRDAAQIGRKRAIQILEYFDHIGFLRRDGEVHKLRAGSEMFVDQQ